MGARLAQGRGAVGRVHSTPGWSALTRSASGVKRSSCSAKKSSSVVGGREVGPEAGELDVGVALGADELEQGRRVGLAEPAHAAVVFDVDARRRPGSAASSESAELSRQAATSAPAASATGVPSVSAPITRIRRLAEARRAARPPRPRGDREPGRAARRARRGRSLGAVAVAVGLDDRAELGPAELPASARSCARSRRCRCAARARFVGGAVTGWIPAGIESITSPAITDSGPSRAAASSPAREWPTTAAQAASNGSMPRAISAPIIPESTSPVPAVASAGLEIRLIATRSASVTIVSSPLSRTTARCLAAPRAQARRRASTSSSRVRAAAHLAGVRGQDGRRLAPGERARVGRRGR